MDNNWPWRRIVLTWVLAIACGYLSAFASGVSHAVIRAVIRACFLFAFLTAFLPMANRLRRRGDSGWWLVLTAAMGWGCLGNACAFLWLDSFALRAYWPLYILAGGVYHVLLYGAYLLGHKYLLGKMPLFLLLLLAACLGYVFFSLPFISSVDILLRTIASSVNSVIVVPAYLLLLFTALNGEAWRAQGKTRLLPILGGLAVLGYGFMVMPIAHMNNVLRECEFMLRHHSSLEPLRGLQGRLRGKGAGMNAYDLDEKGWVPAVIDFSGACIPEVNTKALKNDPPRDAVEKVTTSPDGNYVAELSTAAKETNTALQINNAATGEQLFRGPLTYLGYMPFLAWSDDSKMLVLFDSCETNNIVVCVQDDGSFMQQHIDGELLGFVPSRKDLLFIKNDCVFRQQLGTSPEKLLQVPWLKTIHGMDCSAMITTPDGRFLFMLCDHSRFFYPSQSLLVVANLSERTMFWHEIDTRDVTNYLGMEELPHEQ